MENGELKLNFEEPQTKKDGSLGWLRTNKVPLRDKNENVIGVLGTYEDITDRKRLEDQLRQMQKMEAFGQLAAGVAHDFNNILTVIQGNLMLLQGGQLSKEEQSSAFQQSIAAAQRAADLTRQLLTFGRRQIIQPMDLDLNTVVLNVIKMLKRLIGENILLKTQCAPDGAFVHADMAMMEQVLMNLAINARDAMPKGGTITIQTIAVEIDKEQTHSKAHGRAGKFIRLTVTDTGCGIEPKHLPHIFEPFFTTKEIGKGTGLGLATVFGIVEQHHGWIDVESEVGKGAAMHIFFPQIDRPSKSAS
jgi:signal transduction histidine kinase